MCGLFSYNYKPTGSMALACGRMFPKKGIHLQGEEIAWMTFPSSLHLYFPLNGIASSVCVLPLGLGLGLGLGAIARARTRAIGLGQLLDHAIDTIDYVFRIGNMRLIADTPCCTLHCSNLVSNGTVSAVFSGVLQ